MSGERVFPMWHRPMSPDTMRLVAESAIVLVMGEQEAGEPWWGYLDDGFLMCCIGCRAVKRKYGDGATVHEFSDLEHDADCSAMRVDAAVKGATG